MLCMNPTSQKPLASLPTNQKITLLAISPDKGDRQSLESILDLSSWSIQGAASYREATRLIRESGPSLILCERDLPDGSWKDVFREAGGLRNPPPVVVVSRQADERLWAEVLNLGGYDLLLKPFERTEVRRVMNMAFRYRSRLNSHAPESAVA
jgi:DNA-binding response OmpR family regulator